MHFRIFNLAVQNDALEGEDHVISGHLSAVVKQHPLAQHHIHGDIVHPLNRFSQLQVNSAARVPGDQPVKHVADHGFCRPVAVIRRVQRDR